MLSARLVGVVGALAVAADAGRPQRLAAIVANEKLRGGPGLIAIRDPENGLHNGVTFRARQLAIDFVTGVNKLDQVVRKPNF